MLTLRDSTVRNVGLVAAFHVTAVIINLVALVVLARVLTPFDFGVVAVAGIVVDFIGMFSDFGLASAVVQRRGDVRLAVEVAASARLVFGLVLVPITLLSAPVLAQAFNAPLATDVIRISSILWLISGAGFASHTLLWKNLDFRRQASIGFAISLTATTVAVVLAFSGFAYWSIVFGNIAGALIGLMLLWLVLPWRLRLRLDTAVLRELLKYGKHVFIMSIVTYLALNLDDAVVAVVLGPVMVGFYQIAYKWASVSSSFITRTVGRVLFPTFASIQDERTRLSRGLIESLRAVALIGVPAQIGIILIAPEFISVTLGSNWEPSIVPLQILALAGLFVVSAQPVSDFYLATGRSRVLSRVSSVSVATLAALALVGAYLFGLPGVAIAVVVAQIQTTLLLVWLVSRELPGGVTNIAETFRLPLLGTSAMLVVVILMKFALPPGPLLLVGEVLAGVVTYVTVVYKFGKDVIRRLVGPLTAKTPKGKSVEQVPPRQ